MSLHQPHVLNAELPDELMNQEPVKAPVQAPVQTPVQASVQVPVTAPLHGGDLISASARYGIEPEQWLDLSTGINPDSYPIPPLPAQCFQQLPYLAPAFCAAVERYYGSAAFVACNGTQQAIGLLPELMERTLPVLLPDCGYQEHRHSWQQQGYALDYYPAGDPDAAQQRIAQQLQTQQPFILVVINPNNPTGLSFTPQQLYRWAEQMPAGGYLVVDEAFIDLNPEQSLLADYDRFQRLGNLLVLRSFGKFFGLAGVRLGLLFANAAPVQALQQRIGPWAVNGPAQALAAIALQDQAWQAQARSRIATSAALTHALFQPLAERSAMQPLCSAGLFLSWVLDAAEAARITEFFACRGVLIRLIELPAAATAQEAGPAAVITPRAILRVGLVDASQPAQQARLEQVISEYVLVRD